MHITLFKIFFTQERLIQVAKLLYSKYVATSALYIFKNKRHKPMLCIFNNHNKNKLQKSNYQKQCTLNIIDHRCHL